LADLVAAGDHDTAGIEDAESGQRDLLCFPDDWHEPRAYFDKGYSGHGAADPRRVFISGQKRGVFGLIKRELRGEVLNLLGIRRGASFA